MATTKLFRLGDSSAQDNRLVLKTGGKRFLRYQLAGVTVAALNGAVLGCRGRVEEGVGEMVDLGVDVDEETLSALVDVLGLEEVEVYVKTYSGTTTLAGIVCAATVDSAMGGAGPAGADGSDADVSEWMLTLSAGGTGADSNNTVTLQDSTLLFPIGAGEEWTYVWHLALGNAMDACGLQLDVTGPSGSTVDAAGQVRRGSDNTSYFDTVPADLGISNDPTSGAIVWAHVQNGSTPGNVTLRFAQSSADLGNPIVLKTASVATANRRS